jgi:hypothetical protein
VASRLAVARIWETVDGRFRIKQGPKLLSIETSV